MSKMTDTTRSSTPRARRGLDRRAAAAAELALVLPLLMTIVLGCVDFGRIAYAYIAVANASRVGAEYGATHKFTPYTQSSWASRLRQGVADEMAHVTAFDPAKLQTTISTTTDAYGLVRVTIDVEYPFAVIVPWPGMPQTVSLWRRTSMREIR
jgi:Flp pilus assembly protein TadG